MFFFVCGIKVFEKTFLSLFHSINGLLNAEIRKKPNL